MADSHIVLRPREASDIPQLQDLITNIHAQTGYPVDGPSVFEAFLNPPESEVLCSIVATFDDSNDSSEPHVVGHALVMRPEINHPNYASMVHMKRGGTFSDHGIMSRFFVDPSTQAKGVGTKILREAVRWGHERGIKLALVVLEKDARAVRMYEREGWERVGEYVFKSKWDVEYPAFAYLAP